jgi:hypothetical protein
MTPKEKSEELIKKYKPIVTLKMGFEHTYILKQAKKAALIAVDEILKVSIFFKLIAETEYWNEVKEEIEKL